MTYDIYDQLIAQSFYDDRANSEVLFLSGDVSGNFSYTSVAVPFSVYIISVIIQILTRELFRPYFFHFLNIFFSYIIVTSQDLQHFRRILDLLTTVCFIQNLAHVM